MHCPIKVIFDPSGQPFAMTAYFDDPNDHAVTTREIVPGAVFGVYADESGDLICVEVIAPIRLSQLDRTRGPCAETDYDRKVDVLKKSMPVSFVLPE
jgi:hypothetical protein